METCYVCLEPLHCYTTTECCNIRLHDSCYHELLEYGFTCPFHKVPKPPVKRPYIPDSMLERIVYSIVMCIPLIIMIGCVCIDVWTRPKIQMLKRYVFSFFNYV
jgi:hypothetical protein